MNTVGKILVVLNLVLAIAAGWLVVQSVVLHEPLKARFDAALADNGVLRAQRDTYAMASNKIANDYKEKAQENDVLRQALKDEQDQKRSLEDSYKVKVDERDIKLKDKDESLLQAGQLSTRLTQENALLKTSVKDRESKITLLEEDNKGKTLQALNLQQIANARQAQNEALLEQIQKLTQDIARRDAGVNPAIAVVRDPNSPNPPSVQVSGKIEMVDPMDNSLVQVSLGTDHGVAKHNTLDVYRLKPEPKYLGMIRIVETFNHKSVARLVAAGNPALRPQLRQDDLVTSRITK